MRSVLLISTLCCLIVGIAGAEEAIDAKISSHWEAKGKNEDKRDGEGKNKSGREGEVVEKISVTGSRIQQRDNSSPLLVIDRWEMEKTGYNSIADVLRDLTVNSFGSRRESSGNTLPGVANVNLRGLGADRTLVLIDGKRTQRDVLTNAVDLNLIPFATVERIEIFKDNASAIYGSETFGGVVNIITHKDFNGTEVSVKQLTSEKTGGNQSEVSLTSGYSNRKVSVTGVVYHRTNEAIYAKDRKHSQLILSSVGSPGTFRILNENKAPYKEVNDSLSPRSHWQTTPDCLPYRVFQVKGHRFCQYNAADHMTTRPRLQQTSVSLNTSLKVKEGMDAFVRLSGTHRNVRWVYAPIPAGSSYDLGISGKQARVYMNQAGFPHQVLSKIRDEDFVDIIYRFSELENRQSEVLTDQYSALAGVTIEVKETWEVAISSGYSQSFKTDIGKKGQIRLRDLKSRLSTDFNPFAPSGQRGNLASLSHQTQKNFHDKSCFWRNLCQRGSP